MYGAQRAHAADTAAWILCNKPAGPGLSWSAATGVACVTGVTGVTGAEGATTDRTTGVGGLDGAGASTTSRFWACGFELVARASSFSGEAASGDCGAEARRDDLLPALRRALVGDRGACFAADRLREGFPLLAMSQTMPRWSRAQVSLRSARDTTHTPTLRDPPPSAARARSAGAARRPGSRCPRTHCAQFWWPRSARPASSAGPRYLGSVRFESGRPSRT